MAWQTEREKDSEKKEEIDEGEKKADKLKEGGEECLKRQKKGDRE